MAILTVLQREKLYSNKVHRNIRLDVSGTWIVGNGKAESSEKQRTAGLGVESFGWMNMLSSWGWSRTEMHHEFHFYLGVIGVHLDATHRDHEAHKWYSGSMEITQLWRRICFPVAIREQPQHVTQTWSNDFSKPWHQLIIEGRRAGRSVILQKSIWQWVRVKIQRESRWPYVGADDIARDERRWFIRTLLGRGHERVWRYKSSGSLDATNKCILHGLLLSCPGQTKHLYFNDSINGRETK